MIERNNQNVNINTKHWVILNKPTESNYYDT